MLSFIQSYHNVCYKLEKEAVESKYFSFFFFFFDKTESSEFIFLTKYNS